MGLPKVGKGSMGLHWIYELLSLVYPRFLKVGGTTISANDKERDL